MTYTIKRHRFRDSWRETFDSVERFYATLEDMERENVVRILAHVNNEVILHDIEYGKIVILSYKQYGDIWAVELEESFKIETNKNTIKTNEGTRLITNGYHGMPDVLQITEIMSESTKLDPYMFVIQMNMMKYTMRLGNKDCIIKELNKIIDYANRGIKHMEKSK